MTLDTTYDHNNIFAKIIKGEVPCVRLYEDDNILSFLDVFPQSTGHALVIHKKSTAINILDVEDAHLNEIMAGVRRLATAIRSALNPDGIRVVQFNGAPAGQSVFHLHFHIIPIYEGVALGSHGSGGPADSETLEALAEPIRTAL